MNQLECDVMLEQLKALLKIDSPTGYYRAVQNYLKAYFEDLGFPTFEPNRGGIFADLGGEGDDLVITAHVDTIGLMVRRVKENGHLSVLPLGGLRAINAVRECVRVHTRDGRVYPGTLQWDQPSLHVTTNEHFDKLQTFEYEEGGVEVVLDEPVFSADDAASLGIQCGDIVAVAPRFTLFGNGYIKSQFLDDKACAAVMMAYADKVRRENIQHKRKVWLHFSVTEEVVGGASHAMPKNTTEMLAIDIGCVGPGQYSSEHKVSICARDAKWPYDYEMISKLCNAGQKHGVEFVIDIFHPRYGSDAQGAMSAGNDFRAALIGPGVLGTHGFERTHIESLKNTFDLMAAYIEG